MWEPGTNPSMSSPRFTTIPLSWTLLTDPSASTPGANLSEMEGQGSSYNCFRPREIRLFSASTSNTMTWTSSPF